MAGTRITGLVLGFVIVILALAVFDWGRGAPPPETRKASSDVLKPGTIRVTACDLFEGKALQRVAPHLEVDGGCVQVEYGGRWLGLALEAEIWKGGAVSRGEMSWGPRQYRDPGRFELSFSLKKAGEPGKPLLRFVQVTSTDIKEIKTQERDVHVTGGFIPFPKSISLGSTSRLFRGSFEVTEKKKFPLWAILYGKSSGKLDPFTVEAVDKAAKSADYAIVLKLEVEPRDDKNRDRD